MKPQRLRLKLRQATWRAILEAAEEVAGADGSAGASLQAIADRAGIAVGTIYNYFPDKIELFNALFGWRREELFLEIDAAAKRHANQPFARQLEAFVRAVFGHFDERRAFLRMALAHDAPAPTVAKPKAGGKYLTIRQLQIRAERVILIGVQEKRLRHDDTTELQATILVAILRGVLLARAESSRAIADETERVISLFLDGAAK